MSRWLEASGNESYYPQLDSIIDAFIPHAWEWNWTLDINVLTVNDGPTRVGVNRYLLRNWSYNFSLSHASGSESSASSCDSATEAFVPREWEWIGILKSEAGEWQVCPTHVEMYRSSCRSRILSLGLFHTRGNGSIPSLISWLSHASVPLTWEWIEVWNWIERRWLWSIPHGWEWIWQGDIRNNFLEVCPTWVGMSRSDRFCICCTRSLSHASGNESRSSLDGRLLIEFVPRVSGNESIIADAHGDHS